MESLIGPASYLPPSQRVLMKTGSRWGEYDIGWCDDFGEVAGFGFPEIIEEGMFFSFFTQIFHIIDRTTPTSM